MKALGGHHTVTGAKRGRCRRLTRRFGASDASCAPRPRSAAARPASPRRISRARGATAESQRESPTGDWTSRGATLPEPGGPANQPLKQRTIQIPQVVIPQVSYRLPQILLGGSAKDFRARALSLRPFGTEQDAATPNPVFGAAQGETNVYGLSIKANRRQVVNDRIGRSSWRVTGRLCWHRVPGLVLKNIVNRLELRNSCQAPAAHRLPAPLLRSYTGPAGPMLI